ncbi:hypothetical protein ZWY2020_056001 [Hordeum vulgare]|nr:hypothetical protein ZWY2020_056001 [Hordeum vulgare]
MTGPLPGDAAAVPEGIYGRWSPTAKTEGHSCVDIVTMPLPNSGLLTLCICDEKESKIEKKLPIELVDD